jgi:hypothetical protein
MTMAGVEWGGARRFWIKGTRVYTDSTITSDDRPMCCFACCNGMFSSVLTEEEFLVYGPDVRAGFGW